jgi:hypothetical protein
MQHNKGRFYHKAITYLPCTNYKQRIDDHVKRKYGNEEYIYPWKEEKAIITKDINVVSIYIYLQRRLQALYQTAFKWKLKHKNINA